MDSLIINNTGNKAIAYQELLPQIHHLCEGETSFIANLSNIAAALKQTFNWWWIGFYLVQDNSLVVGPFQGPIACTRIAKGKGVCGMAWAQKKTMIVPDVSQFPGHIACSSESQSEIVVPIILNGEVIGVIDADSELLNHYSEVDAKYLEELARFIAELYS